MPMISGITSFDSSSISTSARKCRTSLNSQSYRAEHHGTPSEKEFSNLFEDLDLSNLGKSESAKNELIVKIINQLNDVDFHLQNTERDVLGDPTNTLLANLPAALAKKREEFHTPQQVRRFLTQRYSRQDQN